MNIAIRADASLKTGMGHVMRSLTLAQGLKEKQFDVSFITFCENDDLFKKAEKGFDNIYRLNDPLDNDSTNAILKNEKIDWVILDGYHFDAVYQKALKDNGFNLLVIDDYAHLQHYYADIILNQNYGAENLVYNSEPYTRLLLGPKYVLLRKEFLKYKSYQKQISDNAEKILITLGGADHDNHTFKIFKAANQIKAPLKLKIVLGASNPHYSSINEESVKSKHTVEILQDVNNMASLMEWADVAVSAGGTTMWELAFMGLPFIAGIVAHNQESAVHALSKQNFPSLGWIEKSRVDDLKEKLNELICNRNRRQSLSAKGKSLVDAYGVQRTVTSCVKTFIQKNIVLRKADIKDLHNVYNLSNQEDVREVSFNQGTIDINEHEQWFNEKIQDSKILFLIAEINNIFLGQIRFDMDCEQATISISLMKNYIGFGAGKILFNKSLEYIKLNWPALITINAYIKKGNLASVSFFRKLGFHLNKELIIKNQNAFEYLYKIKQL